MHCNNATPININYGDFGNNI